VIASRRRVVTRELRSNDAIGDLLEIDQHFSNPKHDIINLSVILPYVPERVHMDPLVEVYLYPCGGAI
jgi:hypothetical protein